jgi:hypothetical protein
MSVPAAQRIYRGWMVLSVLTAVSPSERHTVSDLRGQC